MIKLLIIQVDEEEDLGPFSPDARVSVTIDENTIAGTVLFNGNGADPKLDGVFRISSELAE